MLLALRQARLLDRSDRSSSRPAPGERRRRRRHSGVNGVICRSNCRCSSPVNRRVDAAWFGFWRTQSAVKSRKNSSIERCCAGAAAASARTRRAVAGVLMGSLALELLDGVAPGLEHREQAVAADQMRGADDHEGAALAARRGPRSSAASSCFARPAAADTSRAPCGAPAARSVRRSVRRPPSTRPRASSRDAFSVSSSRSVEASIRSCSAMDSSSKREIWNSIVSRPCTSLPAATA